MFVFMGTYSPGRGGSSGSSNDQQEEEPSEEGDDSQSNFNDFSGGGDEDRSGEEAGEERRGGDTGGPNGSAGGGGGTSAVVIDLGSASEPENDSEENDASEDSNSEQQEEDADSEDGDEDEQDDTVVIVQEVDPLSVMSWGVQPLMKRVEERYQDQVEVYYRTAPVRRFEDPGQMKQQWSDSTENHAMPVTPSFWDENPPGSTELVNKASEAAAQQGYGEDYLRSLWMNGVAAGRTINNRNFLVSLASDMGLDTDQFRKDLEQVELEDSNGRDVLPFTYMEINGNPISRSGRVYYSELKTQFIRAGLEERGLRDLAVFVDDHGPVATVEVMEVYEIGEPSEAVQRLEELDGVSSLEVGGEQFWQLKD